MLTAGIAYNKMHMFNTDNLSIDPASEKISGKQTYKFSNADYKEINVYRPAGFIGITYNFST
ncbi:MAG: hypothetical protein ACTHKY_05775 [Ginsengibacter sp.]